MSQIQPSKKCWMQSLSQGKLDSKFSERIALVEAIATAAQRESMMVVKQI